MKRKLSPEQKLSPESKEVKREFYALIKRLETYATKQNKLCPLDKSNGFDALDDKYVKYQFSISGPLLHTIITGLHSFIIPMSTYSIRMTNRRGSFIVTANATLSAFGANDSSKSIKPETFVKDYKLKVDSMKSNVSANELSRLG